MNVDSFLTAFEEFCRPDDPATTGYYLRGQADCAWDLIPSIARKYEHAGKKIKGFNEQSERDLLHRFRRALFENIKRKPEEWETLFLARHHGLPVRLLDWTANPLVALYNSCAEHEDKDGLVVFVKKKDGLDDLDVFDSNKGPFSQEYQGIRFVHPFYPTQRMTRQSAVFTIHSASTYWQDLRVIIKNLDIFCDIEKIGECIIDKDSKGEILERLQRLGINASTLYPELDWLAKGLWHTEVIRLGI